MRSLIAAAAVVVLGASACTGDRDDDQAADELPVEVEGEVLDRRSPPADEPDEPDEPDDLDEPDEPDDLDVPDEPDEPDDLDGADETDGTEAAAGTSDGAGAPTAGTTPSPSPTPEGGTPSPTPAPAPTPTEPAPTPAPRVVADGPARSTGPVLDSDGVDWTVTSSTTVERGAEPPALTVAMRPGDDTPQRQVACAAALEAPSDRGLVARGTLTVSLRVVRADGAVQVLPRQRIELDVTLEPGRRLDLQVSPGRTVDVAEVRQVTCVADLAG